MELLVRDTKSIENFLKKNLKEIKELVCLDT